MTDTVEQKFWPYVDKSGDCWLWTRSTNNSGYGNLKFNEGRYVVHRFSYELHNGPIPAGMVIDHTCRVRICVNPNHLRAVSQKQNVENHNGLAESTNRSCGIRGVTWHRQGRRWQAQVKHHGRLHSKQFISIDDAAAWVIAKRLELFTHNDMDRRAS